MSNFRRFTRQIPLLIIWLMASGLIWGFVFTRITDTDTAHKLTVYIDAEVPGSAELAENLDDKKQGSIRMIQVRPFNYAMLDSSSLMNADLYIVPESDMEAYRDWFAPLPEALQMKGPAWEAGGIPCGVLIHIPSHTDSNALSAYIRFEPQRYYLCFGKNSLHFSANENASDNEAERMALILLDYGVSNT